MKKNNIINTNMHRMLAMLTVIMLFSGCDSLLDVTPQDKITDISYWNSPSDFEMVANRFYPFLNGGGMYDTDTDLAYNATSDFSESNATYVATETDAVWDNGYSNLRRVNYLLMQAEKYSGNKDQIKNYVAEAYFFRAYIYYGLLCRFGGVPIVTVPLDVNSGELQAPRDSREKVVQFMLSDLDLAIPGLPLENDIPSNEKGHISRQAAQAFKARIALYEATWEKFRGNTADVNTLLDVAINEAKNVMNSNTYSLFTLLADSSYKYLFIIENQKSNPGDYIKKDNHEYILVHKYETMVSTFRISHDLMGGKYNPTRAIADMYVTQNGLPINHPANNQFLGKIGVTDEYMNRDLRMKNTLRVPGVKYYCYGSMGRDYDDPDAPGLHGTGKFQEVTPALGYSVHKFMTERRADDGNEGADWPLIRYPEVLLIYAEALYERNNAISDEDLNKSINILRERGKVAPLTNALVTTYGLDMRQEIRRERAVELFMEGVRMDDLKRWYIAVEELKKPILGILYIGTETEQNYPDPNHAYLTDNEGYIVIVPASQRYFSEKNYLRPIPLTQRFLNPNLEQNPGW
jgi:hypothetical protein